MITTKLILRQDKKDRSGAAPIYLRITKNRKHAYLKTGVKTEPSFWDKHKQRLKTHYPNSGSANALLRHQVFKAESYSHEMEQQQKFYSAAMIKEKVSDQNSDNLIPYAYKWVDLRKESGVLTFSSALKYKGVIKKLDLYCKGNLRIDQFNTDFIKKYALYLRSVKGNHPNTISSNLSCLRALAHTLIEENKIKLDDYPFKGYKLKYEDSQRIFLTPQEIKKIEGVPLPTGSKIKLSQDIFLFCTQTGLRIGDALHLTKENYNGTHLIYFSQKTKDYDTLKLTTKAKAILERYIQNCLSPQDYIFSFLDRTKLLDEELALKDQKSATSLINKNLKIIAKRCKLGRPISTHLARHSLATNALTKGLSMVEVKSILGHSDIRTTQLYAKVVNAVKDAAIDKLE